MRLLTVVNMGTRVGVERGPRGIAAGLCALIYAIERIWTLLVRQKQKKI